MIVQRAAYYDVNHNLLWSDGPGWPATMTEASGVYTVQFPVTFVSWSSYVAIVHIVNTSLDMSAHMTVQVSARNPDSCSFVCKRVTSNSISNAGAEPIAIEICGEVA